MLVPPSALPLGRGSRPDAQSPGASSPEPLALSSSLRPGQGALPQMFPLGEIGAAEEYVSEEEVVLGTIVGRSITDPDIEMQPLKPDDSSVRTMIQLERPDAPLHTVWPSRSKFFCRGFCITGGETELGITPNWSMPNLCAWVCILAPCSLYFLWVLPHLLSQGIYMMPAATAVAFLTACGFLLATCCSDPGIIPRREVILATNSAARVEEALGYDVLASSTVPVDGRGGARNVPPALASRGYRWCRTCRIVRPPRASHCPDCDNCVLRYDHHCPFVNNCVGQRNYHLFFGFVTSVLCLAFLVLPVLFWFLNSDNFEVDVVEATHASSRARQFVFYFLAACGALVGVAAVLSLVLWGYHLFLIATCRTTKEFQKRVPNVAGLTLCAPRGRRLFDPWCLVDPRDLVRHDEPPPPPIDGIICFSCLDAEEG